MNFDKYMNLANKEEKRKYILISKTKKKYKNIFFLSFIFLLTVIYKVSYQKNIFISLNSNSYTIQIKIKGTGSKRICSASTIPNAVYICDSSGVYSTSSNTNQVTLYDLETTLVIHFGGAISGLALFAGLDYLTEVDLSDCSLTDMTQMFSGCTSLTSINFSGANIDSVTKAPNLFYSCESLQSVDLS